MIFAAVDLFCQIIFGGLTVLKLVQVDVVTTHLTLATVFFGCLFWTWLVLSEQNRAPAPSVQEAPRGFSVLARFLPAVILLQLIMGGLVANSYAGAVCVDFPLCNGQLVPTLSGSIGLQVLHRFGAYTVFVVIMAFALFVGKNRFQNWVTPRLRSATWLLVLAVMMQVSLGITNVLMLIPAWLTVLHHTFGLLLFAASLRFVFATLSVCPAVRQGRRA
jgi:cytochrome c oxidase assembly protein subunit 15